ncbi:efflux RND transporter permease subunit [Solimonas soli]|uniref:efflux RND transporter permease subunit n=1 Tax=Solimonas soli TaxID=413479 RepID=UPI0004AEB1DB|nr:efflux RND transporter permease subunit [Solimonas soli]
MSGLAELSVARPVLTIVVSLLILLFGALGITRLPVREYPAVDPPTISVTTSYSGAAAETMQAQITEPIEEAINSVAGITALTSTSREGASQITAEFSLDTDLDTAASDVRDQLSRATRNLPADADPPVLNKANADSSPIFGIALQSARRSQLELSAYADSLRERLQTVPGIAGVDQPAEKRYAMRLWLDPLRLLAYGISPLDVSDAVTRENLELPSGRIEGGKVELPVKTESRLNTAEDFNEMIVKRDGDRVVRFSDIGYAALGPQYERGALKIGDTPIAGLYFRQQPGANQIDIVDELRRRLDQVLKDVPKDINVQIAYDNTEYVRRSLLEVSETIFVAFVLVVLVVFAFLREWRSTLIPVLAIPVSVVGAFGIMSAAGFSINTLTLLGIVLAIGLVVDDAIVVLENIYSKIESGVAPMRAAVEGTREIFTAVVSTTITLVVVFLPLLFMGGLSGRLFREFGVTIAGAVLISAVVALTLTPMLSSRLLRPHEKHGWLFMKTERFFSGMEARYASSLRRFLRRRWLALLVLGASGVLITLLLHVLPRELSPLEDRGRVWLRATAPEGTGYESMQNFMDNLARAAADRVPEAKLMMTQVPGAGNVAGAQGAVNSGFVRIFLKDRDERQRSQQQIAADLQKMVRAYGGARVNVTQEASIGERRSTSSGVQFVLQALNFEALRDRVPAFMEAARRSPVFSFVDSDLKFNKPQIRVTIDRTKALTLGLSTESITRTLQASLSGSRVGYFIRNGKQYDVIGQLTRDFRSRPSDLLNIPVVGASNGPPVTLDNVVQFSENSAPPELYRYNRYNSATVSGTLADGYTIADGIKAFQRIADSTLDERFTTALTGAARDFVESSSSLAYVFVLALVLIYLVLAAQFESFSGPLVILLTVPLALVGALASLWVFGQTLNIFSQIGLIMLIGLVTKNGILIVEFANQRRREGVRSASEAATEAAAARLRPILMTSLATVLGILPIALALGAGSESRMSMGIAVIGGLLCGCALTLYIIPSVYALLTARQQRRATEFHAADQVDGA